MASIAPIPDNRTSSASVPVNSNSYNPYVLPPPTTQSASAVQQPYPPPFSQPNPYLPSQNSYAYPTIPAAPSSGPSPYSSLPQSYQPGPSHYYGAPPQSLPPQTSPYYPQVPSQPASNSSAPKVRSAETTHGLLDKRLSKADILASVSVQDGDLPKFFATAGSLNRYTKMFPEADNDQGCRLFMYGPKCPTTLSMTLFEHFDFPRYSLFPYGLYNDLTTTNKPEAGFCTCQRCAKGENCGHWALHRNLQFYLEQDTAPSSTNRPMVHSTADVLIISSGLEGKKFFKADWNLQIFRFRSRRVETTEFAYDALIYQDYENATKLRSSPLDYLLSQLELILTNWDALLAASLVFLEAFRFEVLQERLETDRNIVRNLVSAAQRWEEFRRVLQNQVVSLEALENIHLDQRWIEGRDDFWEIHAICSGYLQRFKNIDFRICTELITETDTLIQRVTNLISIDEGYRSREQNDSIRRMSWITFIFLPLVFGAGIFGMNVDLFRNNPSWLYYLYTSLVIMAMAMVGYAISRSRRRATKILLFVVLLPLKIFIYIGKTLIELLQKRSKKEYKPVKDLENQEPDPKEEHATVLKWAASSGRTDVIHRILQDLKSDRTKTSGSISSGEAIMMAIKNGHEETANYLIDSEHFDEYRDEINATLLHWAARKGQASVVEKLAAKGMELNAKDDEGRTPLDYAHDSNDEDTINLLLKGGKHISRQDTVNIQTLHFSAYTGDISTIKQLHEKGSSLEARDGKGQTVLFHAVKGQQYAALKWLLEKNINLHAVDKEGFTALHIAARESDLTATKMLVGKGADINALSSDRLTPLLCIVDSKGVDVFKYLCGQGADANAVDKDLNRIAHKIARQGEHAELLWKVAYELGCEVTVSGKKGNTPAHLAAESGGVAILKHLVENNVDVRTCQNIDGYTPLMVAVKAGKADVVRYLLENGCTYEINDANGTSLVELAITWGDPSVMQILQDFGARFDSFDSNANVPHPIWHAILDGQYESVKQVLENGLDPNYTYRGISLLQCAIEAHNTAVYHLLVNLGAEIEKPDSHGWSTLHSCAFSGDKEAFLLALGRAQNKNPKDEYGWTPLDIAAFYRHDEIVKVLDPEGKVTDFAWSNRAWTIGKDATHYYVPPVKDSAVAGFAEAPGSSRCSVSELQFSV